MSVWRVSDGGIGNGSIFRVAGTIEPLVTARHELLRKLLLCPNTAEAELAVKKEFHNASFNTMHSP